MKLLLLLLLFQGSICEKYGHQKSPCIVTTSAYCPPYWVTDTPIPFKVYPRCGHCQVKCEICGKEFIEYGKNDTIYINDSEN